jgi:hypothetical protein
MIGQRAVDRELGKTPRDVATFTGSAMTAPGTELPTSALQRFRPESEGQLTYRRAFVTQGRPFVASSHHVYAKSLPGRCLRSRDVGWSCVHSATTCISQETPASISAALVVIACIGSGLRFTGSSAAMRPNRGP